MAWRSSSISLSLAKRAQLFSCPISPPTATRRHQSTTLAVNISSNYNTYMFSVITARACNYLPVINSPPFFQESRRFMSKYLSKSATKRLPLTNKKAKKGYYKGNGATMEGRITSKGKFIADPRKKLQLIVPDLTGFKLKPYISRAVSKLPPEQRTEMMPGN